MNTTPDTKILYPGAADAARAGCTCDPAKNHYGRGEPFNDGNNRRAYIALYCPLHSAFQRLSDT